MRRLLKPTINTGQNSRQIAPAIERVGGRGPAEQLSQPPVSKLSASQPLDPALSQPPVSTLSASQPLEEELSQPPPLELGASQPELSVVASEQPWAVSTMTTETSGPRPWVVLSLGSTVVVLEPTGGTRVGVGVGTPETPGSLTRVAAPSTRPE